MFVTLIVLLSSKQNCWSLFHHMQILFLIVIIQKKSNKLHISVLVWAAFATTNLNLVFTICLIHITTAKVLKLNQIIIAYSTLLRTREWLSWIPLTTTHHLPPPSTTIFQYIPLPTTNHLLKPTTTTHHHPPPPSKIYPLFSITN